MLFFYGKGTKEHSYRTIQNVHEIRKNIKLNIDSIDFNKFYRVFVLTMEVCIKMSCLSKKR